MVLSKLYDWLKWKDDDTAVVGIWMGLLLGTVAGFGEELWMGLFVGLVFGIIWWFTIGVIGGSRVGFPAGIAAGLTIMLVSGVISGLFQREYGLMIVPVLIIWFVLSEAMYVVQARFIEERRYITVWKVIKKKLEAAADVGIVGFTILTVWWLTKNVKMPVDSLLTFASYVGIIIMGAAAIYGYLKLNQYIANTRKKR